VPDGYYVYRSNTYNVWSFMRGYTKTGVEAAAIRIKDNLILIYSICPVRLNVF